MAFQQVDDFRPPTWPGSSVPVQLHVDFLVDDLEVTGARARADDGSISVLASAETALEWLPQHVDEV